jgi:thermitase
MKPHLVVELRSEVDAIDVPHWLDLARSPEAGPRPFQRDVDRVLRRHDTVALPTHEYQPEGTAWSDDEIAAGLDRVYRLVLLERSRIPSGLVEDIRLVPVVARVEPGRIASMPIAEQAALPGRRSRYDWARDVIHLRSAHEVTRGSRDILVAVLDTGVAVTHPELRHAVVPGFDFVDIIDGAADFIGDHVDADPDPDDEVGHGTHVAGIIAGAGRRMPMGVAPRVRLLPVRVLAALKRDGQVLGAGLVDNINVGVKWAVDQGADVINMSLGVLHTGGGLPHREVIEYAARRGVTVVAASGNDGTDRHYYPGALPWVITVGAVGREDEVASFSTWGAQVDFVAPGTEIHSAFLDDGYAFASGTSHAAPFVAGTVALLRSHAARLGRRYSDRSCKRALRATSDRPTRRMRDLRHGFGRVNTIDALRHVTHDLDRTRRVQ